MASSCSLRNPLLAPRAHVGAPALEVRLPGIGVLPRGVQGGQRVPHVAPHGDVEGEGIAELRRILADADDGARGGEAQVRRIAARVLPIAHAAHDVIAVLGESLDGAA
jgi:hypothetical protein